MTTAVRPSIAVVLAHYDCARYLRAAVESILAQTLTQWKLFLVDDCSPNDDWLHEVKDLSADERIMIGRTRANVGHYRIKNYIIDRTTVEWIAFQDADDVSLPCRLRVQLDYALRHHVDIVGTGYGEITQDGKMSRVRFMPLRPQMVQRFGKSFVMLNGSMLVSRASFFAVEGFDGTARIAADSDFILRSSELLRLANVQQVLYFKRDRPESLTNSPLTGFGSIMRQTYRQEMITRHNVRRRTPGFERVNLLRAPTNDREVEVEVVCGEFE